MGSVVFFWYTMAVLAICFGTACIAGFAYASSARRLFIFLAGLFLVYTFETCALFFNEFVNQSKLVSASGYYSIDNLLLRTVMGTAAQAFTQLAAAALLGKVNWKRTAAICALFFVASLAAGTFVPAGSPRQFVYYTLRQVGFAGILIYLLFSYQTTKDKGLHERLTKYRVAYFVVWALIVLVVVEDFIVTTFVRIEEHPSWMILFLSERNLSENILAGYMAYLTIRHALQLLSIRIHQAPTKETVGNLEQRVSEQMEVYASTHGLSERETQVLARVVLGESNQKIASELYLAEGTVKKHVHNIMVKTGNKDRESLTLNFWRG